MTIVPADLASVAADAAEAGSAVLRGLRDQRRSITLKTERLDVVTDADMAAQAAVLDVLSAARPQDAILTEEGVDITGCSGVRWIVDPLDSTANYARGIPIYSVSVAAEDEEGLAASAVGDPERHVIYGTERGARAVRRNAADVKAEHPTDRRRAVALFGLGPRSSPAHPRTALVPAHLLAEFGKVRSPGSPALGLAWVAAGVADVAYYEMDFSTWDIAAGTLLCLEAGLEVLSVGPAAPGLSPRLLAGPRALIEPSATVLLR